MECFTSELCVCPALSGIKQLAQKGNTWTTDIQSNKNKIGLSIRNVSN